MWFYTSESTPSAKAKNEIILFYSSKSPPRLWPPSTYNKGFPVRMTYQEIKQNIGNSLPNGRQQGAAFDGAPRGWRFARPPGFVVFHLVRISYVFGAFLGLKPGLKPVILQRH